MTAVGLSLVGSLAGPLVGPLAGPLAGLGVLVAARAVGGGVVPTRRPTPAAPDDRIRWAAARDRWLPDPVVRRRIDRALPDLVDEMVRSLHSGATLVGALAEAARSGGPLATDLLGVVDDVRAGAPLGTALQRWEQRRPGTRVGQLASAVDLAAATGGEPARLLLTVSEAVRDDLQVADEARALATQARSSALVVALAPVGFGLLMAPGGTAGFLGSGPGVVVLLAGLLLDAVGLWWMWRIGGSER